MQNSATAVLNGTTSVTVTVQQITNGKRRLLQSGPVAYIQVHLTLALLLGIES
jgi:hypothetical protein